MYAYPYACLDISRLKHTHIYRVNLQLNIYNHTHICLTLHTTTQKFNSFIILLAMKVHIFRHIHAQKKRVIIDINE